jgi:hypothetical protein
MSDLPSPCLAISSSLSRRNALAKTKRDGANPSPNPKGILVWGVYIIVCLLPATPVASVCVAPLTSYRIDPLQPLFQGPVLVLTSGRSISAAEVAAATPV